MNAELESIYQEIGTFALASAENAKGRVLIYAEIEKDVISADLFYEESSGNVRFRFCSSQIQKLVYALWEAAQPKWYVLCYCIDGGKFTIDLTYPDKIDLQEDVADRRPRAIENYFPGKKVDYSRP